MILGLRFVCRERRLLCDNESFMAGNECKKEYRKKNIQLLNIPPRSPDFNPIESFWGWLRQAMRRRNLEDMRDKRPALGKTAWMCRLKRSLKTQKAQTVAKHKFQNLKKACKVVYKKNGAHSGLWGATELSLLSLCCRIAAPRVS